MTTCSNEATARSDVNESKLWFGSEPLFLVQNPDAESCVCKATSRSDGQRIEIMVRIRTIILAFFWRPIPIRDAPRTGAPDAPTTPQTSGTAPTADTSTARSLGLAAASSNAPISPVSGADPGRRAPGLNPPDCLRHSSAYKPP